MPAATKRSSEVECANVERAYKAWTWAPVDMPSTGPMAWVGRVGRSFLIEKGKVFADNLGGYPDGPVKGLAVAVASHNLAFTVVNGEFANQDTVSDEAKERVLASVRAVDQAYRSFEFNTC